jgi:hypothetical protein
MNYRPALTCKFRLLFGGVFNNQGSAERYDPFSRKAKPYMKNYRIPGGKVITGLL